MREVIPLFKSHYSIGKSILTLENPEDILENGSDSIIDICKKNNLNSFFLVDDSMSGFLQAYTNSKKNNLKLIYGLRITVCSDILQKNEESLTSNNKVVIFCKNTEGYKRLIKISSKASLSGFYYEPRIDYSILKEFWNEEDLMLLVGFHS